MRTFRHGYLAAVTGLLLSWNSILVVKFFSSDVSNLPDWCSGLEMEPNQQFLYMIPSIFCVLSLLFTVLLTCRTNTLLKTIQPQHFQNLPSKNALTFLDTQILFVSIIVQFFVISFISILSYFLGISHDQFIFLKVILHFFIDNVFICFIFPIYIILKTKKYFPRMWNDNSQLLHQNNDSLQKIPLRSIPNLSLTIISMYCFFMFSYVIKT